MCRIRQNCHTQDAVELRGTPKSRRGGCEADIAVERVDDVCPCR